MRISAKDARKIGITPQPRTKSKAKKGPDAQRALFIAACKAHGLPEPVAEFRFAEDIGRKWRLDYFWGFWLIGRRDGGVALEIDGGAWSQGRHTRGEGFIEDQRKRNEAVLRGIWVLNCTPQDVESGEVFSLLRRAMKLEARDGD